MQSDHMYEFVGGLPRWLSGEESACQAGDMGLTPDASGLEDVKDFVTIYSICKTTGASLITALGKAAGVIMEKMSIDREVDR